MRQMLRDLLRLVRSWWRHDRIRVSVAEGRLLRLERGAVVMIDGRWVEIVDREVFDKGDEMRVEYRCRSESGEFRLVVGPPSLPT